MRGRRCCSRNGDVYTPPEYDHTCTGIQRRAVRLVCFCKVIAKEVVSTEDK